MSDEDRKARMEKALAEARARTAEQAAKRKQTNKTLSGVAKAGVTGVRRGSEALVGTPGDAPGMLGGAWSWLNRKLGANELDAMRRGKAMETATLATLDPRAKIEMVARMLGMSDEPIAEDLPRIWPTSQEVHQAVSNAYPDEATKEWTEHVPEGPLERGIQTVGEMAPNLLFTGPRAVASAVLAPAAGAELGGAIGDQFGYEGAGRFLGGLGGSLLPGGVTRSMTGPPIAGERARLVNTLLDEGVDLTAGQASGSKRLQYREVGPYETKAAGIGDRQAGQFNRAALSRAGIQGDILSPQAVRQARERFGLEYDRFIGQLGGLPVDQAALDALATLTDDFHRIKALPSGAPTLVNSFADRILEAASRNRGNIPSEVFQQIRSDISRTLRTIAESDPALSHSLEDMQDVLYGALERTAPGQSEVFRDLNNRYRNLKILEKSMRGAGEATAEGNITPGKLGAAVEKSDPSGYVAGEGDFADLARAGRDVMTPLPQTGSAPRALSWGYPMAIGAEVGRQMTQGNFGRALGTVGAGVAGALVPAGLSSLLTSGPVRNALIRRITGEQGHFNPLATALTARQLENEGRR